MLKKSVLLDLVNKHNSFYIFNKWFIVINIKKNSFFKMQNWVQLYMCLFKITKNNIFINILNLKGKTLFFYSGGQKKKNLTIFKKAFSSLVLGELTGLLLKKLGISFLFLEVYGFGSIKKQFLRGLLKYHLNILGIEEATPIPHNGCRLKKTSKYR